MSDKAILCGINDYEGISDLRGCENDLESIRQLLVDVYDFDPAHIRIHRNEDVVRGTIEEGFDWLAADSKPEDRLVFHFSGHGSYTESKSSDKDVDELLCLYDMDWENEATFLRDTDLGALTRRVDSGARLTVILDSCHSGTGTRGVTIAMRAASRVTSKTGLIIVQDTANQLAKRQGSAVDHADGLVKARAGTMRMLKSEETPPVYARFVEPPAKIQEAVQRSQNRRVRTLGESMRTELNHQLLAAAHEKQTAADAYIAGDYHGAFSYYLSDTARTSPSDSCDTIMKQATQRIKSEGYSQDPQSEGRYGTERLFGGATAATNPVDDPPIPEKLHHALTNETSHSTSLPESPSASRTDARPLETLNHLLRVSEKLIDLARPAGALPEITTAESRGVDNEVIVYVHGISEHLPGFSIPWHNALAPYLSHRIRREEVRWSQHVNSRATPESLSRSTEMTTFEAEVRAEMERRMERLDEVAQRRAAVADARAGAPVRMERARSFSIDDFTRYMFVESTRELILAEFTNLIRGELAAGRKVHVISHSWGTVVAYEGLRRFDNQSLSGRVANLFVVGSALSINAVQSNLFGRVGDGRVPAHVDFIANLDAGGDVVGGPIGDAFAVDREFIGLPPVGCRTIPFTSIAINPQCAHSSYFVSANREVNRDIFASFINRT